MMLGLPVMMLAALSEPSLDKLAVLVAPDGDGFEIVAHAGPDGDLWATRTGHPRLTRVDVSDLTQPRIIGHVDLRAYGTEVTSVVVGSGVIAATLLADPSTERGTVVLLDLEGAFLDSYRTGAHPDRAVFSADGTRLLIANEGEPAGDVDPPGTLSVFRIDQDGVVDSHEITLGDSSGELVAGDVTWFTPMADTPSQMVEPESIAFTADGSLAVVAAQENNGFAVIDLTVWPPQVIAQHDFEVLAPESLGLIDVLDDGQLKPAPATFGAMPQPDGIAIVSTLNGPIVLTADEGDPRAVWGRDAAVERNGVEQTAELYDGMGLLFGARGLSAWTIDGQLITRAASPVVQWALERDDMPLAMRLDRRSDRRGEEPEELVAWQASGRTLVVCGFERAGVVGLFEFAGDELITLDLARIGNETGQAASPEGLAVFERAGQRVVVVADESGGTLSLFEVSE